MKKFITGFLVSAILFLTFSAFADNVEVAFNNIKIKINGADIEADNILYNGITYVPLRKCAEMFGKTVIWDASTNTANIIEKPEPEFYEENPNIPSFGYILGKKHYGKNFGDNGMVIYKYDIDDGITIDEINKYHNKLIENGFKVCSFDKELTAVTYIKGDTVFMFSLIGMTFCVYIYSIY